MTDEEKAKYTLQGGQWSWNVYEEPKISFTEPMIKALKKFLRMQKKNRRRWGE